MASGFSRSHFFKWIFAFMLADTHNGTLHHTHHYTSCVTYLQGLCSVFYKSFEVYPCYMEG